MSCTIDPNVARELDSVAERLRDPSKGHFAKKLMSGKTPAFASVVEPRCSFTTYIPTCHSHDGPPLPLVVTVHGTGRKTYLDSWVKFAEEHRCVILAPLFPCGIIEPTDIHNYKSLLFHDIRFDHVLLSIIDQASHIWRIRTDKFFLHGFSGGGQFGHRFFYLHSHRLAGLSVGAPGGVTLPNPERPWPYGISNFNDHFSLGDVRVPDFELMSRVPLHFVVGEDDVDTKVIDAMRDPSTGIREPGNTRVERIQLLRDALIEKGIQSSLDIVPGLAHEGAKMVSTAQQFLGPLVDGLHT